jgi:plasmid stabilization system protein ParE
MSYIVKARARADLKRHWRYIATDNPDAADRLLRAAEETFAFIAANPDIGSQRSFRRLVGVRSMAVAGFRNYLVFDQRRGDRVVMLRVLHGMMDLPGFFIHRGA